MGYIQNSWRDQILWDAAERIRNDFNASGISPKMSGVNYFFAGDDN